MKASALLLALSALYCGQISKAQSATVIKSASGSALSLVTPGIVQPAPSALVVYSNRIDRGMLGGISDRVDLRWQDNSRNEYTYRVERCAGATCTNFVEIAKLPANTTHFVQVFAPNRGKVYRYRVRDRGPYGFSAYTKIVNATLR